jgi:ubiquinone/menaquinone biosynthesis C-methylase UbiE
MTANRVTRFLPVHRMPLTAILQSRGKDAIGFYARHVPQRTLDFTMRQKVPRPFREQIAGAAEGRVLEIGLGARLKVPLFGGNVRSVNGLEPSAELLRLARRNPPAVPIELVEGSAEALPLEDRSVDIVVTTWTLCTNP